MLLIIYFLNKRNNSGKVYRIKTTIHFMMATQIYAQYRVNLATQSYAQYRANLATQIYAQYRANLCVVTLSCVRQCVI